MKEKEDNIKKKSFDLIKTYLLIYNLTQFICWLTILLRLLDHDYNILKGENSSLYQNIIWPITITHLLANLEIIHAITNIVPSNLRVTLMQIFLRMYIACIISHVAQYGIGFAMVIHAWTFADLIRYSYYTLYIMKIAPYFVRWLRYSVFVVAYPLGAVGEHFCLFAAHMHVMRFGPWNVRIANTDIILLHKYILYILWVISAPMLLHLYMHMLKQRKKVLGRQSFTDCAKHK
ncbi:hypothetical protein ILUMI_24320 [Ignelater luminosus]|uniref:Very-long-chain (3R)-3-hydroxyacyl-CoA dehydratase n=1 Tax=Ignelater luminosus TaxID=2038154 RepID=A0A8K0CAF8_IGNLU|nr:hypothetical protein ILUMI_24320 [Ignelater luminosus]